MKDTWKIAKWEVMRNLTNKQFIIGLLLTPVIMVVFGGLPVLLQRWNEPAVVTYYVVDELGVLPSLKAQTPDNVILEEYAEKESIEKAVQENKAAGYFLLDSGFVNTGQIELKYNERNNESITVIRTLLTRTLQNQRIQMAQIAPEQVAYLTAPAEVISVPISEADEPEAMEMLVSTVFVVLIFFLIFTSGTMLMQSALQERRDRMAEVVLSSILPSQLMQGKILGHFLLGMIQLVFWLIIGLPLVIYFIDFPVWEAISATNIPLLLFFGLLGYLLFSALFVSMGATMEDLQSAGNSQGLVIMIPMMSFLFLGPVMSNPDGTIAVFASLFPFTSPAIMIIRNAMTKVPGWQMLVSAILLLITTWVISKLAAKIFRIGMLMYGKTATIGEIVKWVRYKES
ncbi:MAG: ABC transporter permease [Firmicutes bacterium]|nr:ABC transporter permease [Bacillota bacterium]